MSMILLIGLLPLVHELLLVVVVHLQTLSEKVFGLAALEACPRVPPHVMPSSPNVNSGRIVLSSWGTPFLEKVYPWIQVKYKK
jgi:hypothetical protein